jgi:hypothetical protein
MDLSLLAIALSALAGPLLEPHLRAWTGYTARMDVQNHSHPDALSRGDAGLFSWRLASTD